jgi:peptide/nickel transport system substrate-binding protein
MRINRYLAAGAAVATMSLVLAACGGGGASGPIGNGSTAATGPKEAGGIVNIAQAPGATPNFIFPLAPATNENGYNFNLDMGMWPFLVYSGDGSQSIANPQESPASSITYSNSDKTITIVLKPWKWSDGVPVTSRDFSFVYNLLKANRANWSSYVQGLFPDNVASVTTPNASTAVINLDRSYNPAFYSDDVLSLIPLLPQHAWDKTSMTGKVANYDETTAGAKAVYAFLQKEGGQLSSFATNPLWKVVDGPWQLASFTNNGYYSQVPNKSYSGQDKPVLAKVNFVPYTTDTAELDALRAGGSLDVGYLPLNDLAQVDALKAQGYSVASQAIPGVAEIQPNLWNPTVGPMLRQLYIRQVLEYLINRPQIVSKVYAGYADPGNGPISVLAGGPWVSPLEEAGGPYPYSPSKAIALLKAHGWKVVPDGTSSCQRPGTGATDCGAGITAGEQLNFQFGYSSGTASMDEQNAAIQATEAQAGVKMTLKSEPFNSLISTMGNCWATSHPASTCGWQLIDYGYDPYELYPAGEGLFNTDGYDNSGGYSTPEEDNLINQTEYGASPSVFFTYENYTDEQLPYLWIPDASTIWVYKSNLQGFAPLNPFSAGLNPEVWYYTKS